jgi:hypothetical protein
MSEDKIRRAVRRAAERLSTGDDKFDTAGMDIAILRKYALGEDITWLVRAVKEKIRQREFLNQSTIPVRLKQVLGPGWGSFTT